MHYPIEYSKRVNELAPVSRQGLQQDLNKLLHTSNGSRIFNRNSASKLSEMNEKLSSDTKKIRQRNNNSRRKIFDTMSNRSSSIYSAGKSRNRIYSRGYNAERDHQQVYFDQDNSRRNNNIYNPINDRLEHIRNER